jgi:hypothetical protein
MSSTGTSALICRHVFRSEPLTCDDVRPTAKLSSGLALDGIRKARFLAQRAKSASL